MKIYPVWAKRATTCETCGDPIEPGTPRITSTTKVNDTYRRTHYHFQPCFVSTINSVFESSPYEPLGSKGGRPKLLITDEQRVRRNLLLRRLFYMKKRYGDVVAKVLMPKRNGDDALSEREIIEYARFISLRDSSFRELETLGGVPEHYK